MAKLKAPVLASAQDVAEYLVSLAAAEDEDDFLSPLRLQKLLYYAQGWSLGVRDHAIFSDKIEAWTHGPVVRSVYSHYAHCGGAPIRPTLNGATNLSKSDQEFLNDVWAAYKGFSATALRDMTHKESPWIDAYRGPNNGQNPGTITLASMKSFFARKAAE